MAEIVVTVRLPEGARSKRVNEIQAESPKLTLPQAWAVQIAEGLGGWATVTVTVEADR